MSAARRHSSHDVWRDGTPQPHTHPALAPPPRQALTSNLIHLGDKCAWAGRGRDAIANGQLGRGARVSAACDSLSQCWHRGLCPCPAAPPPLPKAGWACMPASRRTAPALPPTWRQHWASTLATPQSGCASRAAAKVIATDDGAERYWLTPAQVRGAGVAPPSCRHCRHWQAPYRLHNQPAVAVITHTPARSLPPSLPPHTQADVLVNERGPDASPAFFAGGWAGAGGRALGARTLVARSAAACVAAPAVPPSAPSPGSHRLIIPIALAPPRLLFWHARPGQGGGGPPARPVHVSAPCPP